SPPADGEDSTMAIETISTTTKATTVTTISSTEYSSPAPRRTRTLRSSEFPEKRSAAPMSAPRSAPGAGPVGEGAPAPYGAWPGTSWAEGPEDGGGKVIVGFSLPDGEGSRTSGVDELAAGEPLVHPQVEQHEEGDQHHEGDEEHPGD